MQCYKRSQFELIKWCIYAPLFGFIAYLVAGIFTDNLFIKCAVGAGLGLLLLLVPLFDENIRFELSEDGELRYYKMGRLKRAIPLAGCKTDYQHTPERVFFTTADICLILTGEENTLPFTCKIDCSALGLRRFRHMFAALRAYTGEPLPPSARQATARKHSFFRGKTDALADEITLAPAAAGAALPSIQESAAPKEETASPVKGIATTADQPSPTLPID